MNAQIELLLDQARNLPDDQREEFLRDLLRSFAPKEKWPTEVREAVRKYDPRGLLQVEAFWDSESEMWVASSPDVEGLTTEAADLASLARKLAVIIPDLLDASGKLQDRDRCFELRAFPIALVA